MFVKFSSVVAAVAGSAALVVGALVPAAVAVEDQTEFLDQQKLALEMEDDVLVGTEEDAPVEGPKGVLEGEVVGDRGEDFGDGVFDLPEVDVTQEGEWFPKLEGDVWEPEADEASASASALDKESINYLYGAQINRAQGSTRYETALAISKRYWSSSNAKNVFIANGATLVDAFVAGTLTKQMSKQQLTAGPILLTRANQVDSGVLAEIRRLGNPEVIVIGGTGVVTDAVAKAYNGGVSPQRVAGGDRFETSVAVSRMAFPDGANRAYVTNGMGTPDGVVGAALTDGPILLVNPKTGPTEEVKQEINRLGVTQIVKLGGTDLKLETTGAIAGKNRYETAAKVAAAAFPGTPSTVFLARGDSFADAIAAGSVTAKGPILLVGSRTMPAEACRYLMQARPDNVIALGGDRAVYPDVLYGGRQCANGTYSVFTVPVNTCPAGQQPGGAVCTTSSGCTQLCYPDPQNDFEDVNDVVYMDSCPGTLTFITYRRSKGWTRPAAIEHFKGYC